MCSAAHDTQLPFLRATVPDPIVLKEERNKELVPLSSSGSWSKGWLWWGMLGSVPPECKERGRQGEKSAANLLYVPQQTPKRVITLKPPSTPSSSPPKAMGDIWVGLERVFEWVWGCNAYDVLYVSYTLYLIQKHSSFNCVLSVVGPKTQVNKWFICLCYPSLHPSINQFLIPLIFSFFKPLQIKSALLVGKTILNNFMYLCMYVYNSSSKHILIFFFLFVLYLPTGLPIVLYHYLIVPFLI